MTGESIPKDGGARDSKEVDFMLFSYEKNKSKLKSKSTEAVKPASTYSYKYEDIVWRNVIAFIYLHASSFYGIYLICIGEVKLSTFVFGYLYGLFGAIGVTAGAHRLWAHGAYKAKWPLRCLLMVLQTMAFQNCIWEWVRDHRVHHKYTDTNADPHNYSRGFFFAHMGWLMLKKHPMVKEKGARIDLSDIDRDPICRFQRKYYLLLMPVLAFIVPTAAMYYVFGQDFSSALHSSNLRYFLSLHYAWLVNSAAHFWGDKPFDKDIKPTDNPIIAFITIGEGWHNYHHVFPWDYKAAELGNYIFNLTTSFIDFFAFVGWAYDLKCVSNPMICKRAMRTGDGSYKLPKHNAMTDTKGQVLDSNGNEQPEFDVDHENMLWGWHDRDLPEVAKQYVDIRNRLD